MTGLEAGMEAGAEVSIPGLGPLESAVMTAVWDAAGPLTVQAVLDRLAYSGRGGGAPAYTTVMTVMNNLRHKGLLARARNRHSQAGARAWWYQASISREGHLARVVRSALIFATDPAEVLRLAQDGGPGPGLPPWPGPTAVAPEPA